MTRGTTIVGMDVHKASINVAVLEPGKTSPVEWVVENRASLVAKLGQKLKRDYGDAVTCCYEAGPCGFALMRDLSSMGISCKVIAPSLIPKQPGNRVKTDRRDVRNLALLFQAGLLTEVSPPTAAQEAVRDLCRARDDARDERLRAQHRLVKFLLRHGLTFAGATQTRRFHQWLSTLTFEHAPAQATFDHYVRTLVAAQERQKTLDERIEEIARTPEHQGAVGMLRCFRGIDTTSAMILLSELGDITRFESPRKLMAFWGITPSEYSSGGKEKRGRITKTGNRHVRRLLVEAAWHYRHHSSVGKELQARRRDQPGWAVNLAEKCQLRLCRRHRRLVERGKAVNKAVGRQDHWSTIRRIRQHHGATFRQGHGATPPGGGPGIRQTDSERFGPARRTRRYSPASAAMAMKSAGPAALPARAPSGAPATTPQKPAL